MGSPLRRISSKTGIKVGEYLIDEHQSENVFPFEKRPFLFTFANQLTWALWTLHVLYSCMLAMAVEISNAGRIAYLVAILCEICHTLPELLLAIIIFKFPPSSYATLPLCRTLISNHVPAVDVFVLCCGEDLEVLEDTITAVLLQDYPAKFLHVYVLDDGRSQDLQTLIKSLNHARRQNATSKAVYLARDDVSPSYFKAGNLQFGLNQSRLRTNSEFIAVVDADMIPCGDWLRTILPHLLDDASVAIVCPPQHFYNVSASDIFGNGASMASMRTIFHPLYEQAGEAFCTGTGFVVRRAAVESIGGWPLIEAAEDYMCSIALRMAGWKTVYRRDLVQSGLAPVTFKSFIKQKMRWSDSTILVSRKINELSQTLGADMPKDLSSGFSFMDLIASIEPLTDVLVFVASLILPLALQLTSTLTVDITSTQIITTKVLFTAWYFTDLLCHIAWYSHLGLRDIDKVKYAKIWASPCKRIFFLWQQTHNKHTM